MASKARARFKSTFYPLRRHRPLTLSDVLVIDKSATDDVSCLPSAATTSAPQYTVADPLSQCESFSVDYNPAVAAGSPTVRAFVPQRVG